jgi:hypothetical protein
MLADQDLIDQLRQLEGNAEFALGSLQSEFGRGRRGRRPKKEQRFVAATVSFYKLAGGRVAQSERSHCYHFLDALCSFMKISTRGLQPRLRRHIESRNASEKDGLTASIESASPWLSADES